MKAPKNIVASVLARLRNEADAQRVPFNQVLQFYAIERFLHRLSQTRHSDSVLLKGALLLKTVGIPRARPTMDIDLLRQGKADRDSLIAIARDCALIEDPADGVMFDPGSIATEEIARDAEYLGTRVLIAGRMDNVRLRVQIDFGVGDVVIPGARVIEYPTLLNAPEIRLKAYPVEVAVAEKFQAMVELDIINSRVKDFYDVRVLARHLSFDGATLVKSIAATFARRATTLPIVPPTAFTPAYYESDTQTRQWRAFTRRIGEPALAGEFPNVVGDVAAFVMPPALAAGRSVPFKMQWSPAGPWI